MRSLGKAGAFDIFRLTDKRQPGRGVIDSKRCTWTLDLKKTTENRKKGEKESKRQHKRGSSNRLTYTRSLCFQRRERRKKEGGRKEEGYKKRELGVPTGELEGGRKGNSAVAGSEREEARTGPALSRKIMSVLSQAESTETRMRGRDMK